MSCGGNCGNVGHMSVSRIRLRLLVPAVTAVVLLSSLYAAANLAVASPANASEVAASYKFQELPIAMPPGYHPTQTLRKVNPAYQHLVSWISSVGASIAMTDVTGHGRDDGMCIVDPRTDDVIVTYAPTASRADRFTPFVLNAAPLPMNSTMAPMGCVPGDYNGDGRTDFLVYYWGRTPIVFLARSTATTPAASAYRPVELMPEDVNGQYDGPLWNTNAVAVANFEGNGDPDLFVGNYFPDSEVLNPNGINDVQMPSSLSDALNGGGDYIFRWLGGTSGADPTVRYQLVQNAIPYADSTGCPSFTSPTTSAPATCFTTNRRRGTSSSPLPSASAALPPLSHSSSGGAPSRAWESISGTSAIMAGST
jgi:hypothetical protein